MNDAQHPDRAIDSLLSESGFSDDAMLRDLLIQVRARAVKARPLPGSDVARLMTPVRRRRSRLRRRYVVAVVVGATVLGGGAAAASPLLGVPGSATAIIAGLFGSPVSGPHPTPSASAHRASSNGLDHSSHSAATVSHPTPTPVLPAPAAGSHPGETHPLTPTPLPTPQSGHADDHVPPENSSTKHL